MAEGRFLEGGPCPLGLEVWGVLEETATIEEGRSFCVRKSVSIPGCSWKAVLWTGRSLRQNPRW